ncbi:DUF4382 domain-containing protein [Sinomicrobium kalidii]|uniref:DUF4382 domain-containing protein n=1 Tax=Sinomicrobium kalidii TaxID=2900738 RepID=UPI001E502FD0|nr:DUF4382 domain-containing protein [Sinomicrobium kalidii]UGU17801.1 DUF4382 domain-containing protein [Sinomicrobium kalidii]
MKRFKFLAVMMSVVFLGTGLFISCSNDDDSNNGQTAKVSVRLTDAPGDYEAVNIDVQDVLVNRDANDTTEGGWESIGLADAGIYDLLELTGGTTTLLVEGDIPSGRLEQIRLVLGEQNTVVIDGDTIPLTTPSAQQSGLKLNVHEDLEAGFTYDFTLDFDVDQSVVKAGASGKYNLKPVIRVSTEISSGIITGAIAPVDLGFQVLASVQISEEETISAYTDENGTFMLYGVPEGTYTVTLTADEASGLPPVTVDNVIVVNGEISDIGTIDIDAEQVTERSM